MTATLQGSAALAVESMRADVDVLLAVHLTSLSSTELTGLVADLGTQRRRTEDTGGTRKLAHRMLPISMDARRFLKLFLDDVFAAPRIVVPLF